MFNTVLNMGVLLVVVSRLSTQDGRGNTSLVATVMFIGVLNSRLGRMSVATFDRIVAAGGDQAEYRYAHPA